MRGYKAFNEDLTCRDMQYEIGKTYEFDGEPIPCEQGLHFCKTIADCYRFYPKKENTRICMVEALGDITTDDNIKYCTNKIKIIEEITNKAEKKGNYNDSSTGYSNRGNNNTGNNNTGNCNTGNFNTGNYNTGRRNDGSCNVGDNNIGNFNTGFSNIGNFNTGTYNLGIKNSGDGNIGNYNTGNFNFGYRNTGDYNLSDYNAGCFNTETPYMTFFDKPSNWTYQDWLSSRARNILLKITDSVEYVSWEDMTEKERKQHPEYEAGNFHRLIRPAEKITTQDRWDNLPPEDKEIIYNIPNFDKEKFEKIMGIKIDK